MQRYKEKGRIVEAMQLTTDNIPEIETWLKGKVVICDSHGAPCHKIDTPERVIYTEEGNWILRDAENGHLMVDGAWNFEQDYDLVDPLEKLPDMEREADYQAMKTRSEQIVGTAGTL